MRYYVSGRQRHKYTYRKSYVTFYIVIPAISSVPFMNFYLSCVNTGAVTQLPHAKDSLTYTHINIDSRLMRGALFHANYSFRYVRLLCAS